MMNATYFDGLGINTSESRSSDTNNINTTEVIKKNMTLFATCMQNVRYKADWKSTHKLHLMFSRPTRLLAPFLAGPL
jgi:hypothetical protein